jgi:hypothetical protein
MLAQILEKAPELGVRTPSELDAAFKTLRGMDLQSSLSAELAYRDYHTRISSEKDTDAALPISKQAREEAQDKYELRNELKYRVDAAERAASRRKSDLYEPDTALGADIAYAMASHSGQMPEETISFGAKGSQAWWRERNPTERVKAVMDHESLRQSVESAYRDQQDYERSIGADGVNEEGE